LQRKEGFPYLTLDFAEDFAALELAYRKTRLECRNDFRRFSEWLFFTRASRIKGGSPVCFTPKADMCGATSDVG